MAILTSLLPTVSSTLESIFQADPAFMAGITLLIFGIIGAVIPFKAARAIGAILVILGLVIIASVFGVIPGV